MVDTYFVIGRSSTHGSMSSHRISFSRMRPTASRAPTKKKKNKTKLRILKKCQAPTRKNKEVRRVARRAAGVGGVIMLLQSLGRMEFGPGVDVQVETLVLAPLQTQRQPATFQ